MKIVISMGPKTLPCGIPDVTLVHSEQTHCLLLDKKCAIHFKIQPLIPICDNLKINFVCDTRSNALAKSK